MLHLLSIGDSYVRGEQLFENYGQPNHIYFMYHGFVLPDNSHDCVHHSFFLETAEYERLVRDGLQSYLETVFGIYNSGDVFPVCLTTPLPGKLWIFWGLKVLPPPPPPQISTELTPSPPQMNTYRVLGQHSEHRVDLKALSQPSPTTLRGLQRHLKTQLSHYRNDPEAIGHAGSFAFLQSEQQKLRLIQKHLAKLAEEIDDDEEEERDYSDDEL